MHLEVLVEDQSGKRMLDAIIPKIIGDPHSFRVHAYKGIGRIPKDLKGKPDPAKRILLNELPRLLQGYGVAFSQYPSDYRAHVAVVCDLDDKNSKQFSKELEEILASCKKKPPTEFYFAVEEGEAWLLGDRAAVEQAYPKVNKKVLDGYAYDSICGTWELLADAIYIGGAAALMRGGWQAVGYEKSKWADAISPLVEIDRNRSPSFVNFCRRLHALGYV